MNFQRLTLESVIHGVHATSLTSTGSCRTISRPQQIDIWVYDFPAETAIFGVRGNPLVLNISSALNMLRMSSPQDRPRKTVRYLLPCTTLQVGSPGSTETAGTRMPYIGDWYGVTADADSRVVELVLSPNNLRGKRAAAEISLKPPLNRSFQPRYNMHSCPLCLDSNYYLLEQCSFCRVSYNR